VANHFWLFPWFALVAGLAALLFGGLARGAATATSPDRPPPSLLLLWLLAVIGGTLGSLRLGAAAGVDVIGARGLLLGALGGAGLVLLCRGAASPARPPRLLGLGTALVAGGRLWLTHGEITGLTSLALGVALSVLCLDVAPSLLRSPTDDTDGDAASASALAMLYVLGLAAATVLGFVRAQILGDMYWAGIPLLLGGGLSLGAAVGAGLARRFPSLPPALPTLLAGLLVAVLLSRLAHSWRPLEMLGMGAALFGLLGALSVRPDTEGEATETSGDRLGPLVGFVLIVAGCALAFALWSGYGLGLLLLGGWLVAGPRMLTRRADAAIGAGLGFGSVLLIHRLAVLQNTDAVRASGPGDTWDLFAIGLGALLPLLAAEWARRDASAGRLPGWAIALQWLLALVVPALLLDYLWPPRSVAGVLLGAALGQLLAALDGDADRRASALAVGGVLFSLMLFQFLPALQEINPPTRYLRVAVILGAALLLVLRLFVPGRAPRRAVV